jgi:hypothetical protein
MLLTQTLLEGPSHIQARAMHDAGHSRVRSGKIRHLAEVVLRHALPRPESDDYRPGSADSVVSTPSACQWLAFSSVQEYDDD